MNLFQKTLHRQDHERPPIWFMRQAGRYHSHYQNLRGKYSFLDLCKIPDLATETALGPVDDFGFDAAILFSDILFPLEAMGTTLDFNPGPTLGFHLKTPGDLERYHINDDDALRDFFDFQHQALKQTRAALPKDKGLIGFVGGIATLYVFACCGGHKNMDKDLIRQGLSDGRFQGFAKKLLPVLWQNIKAQAEAAPDCLAILDSASDWLSADEFQTIYLPILQNLLQKCRNEFPDLPILYYGKFLSVPHWQSLRSLPIHAIGFDWQHDLSEMMNKFSDHWLIQGNFDPHWMTLPRQDCEELLRKAFTPITNWPAPLQQAWICGLGHGMVPDAKEDNVRLFMDMFHKIF